MAEIRAPLAANICVFAIHVDMGVEGSGAGVGIVAGDDVRAAVSKEREPFSDGVGVAAGLDDHVRTTAVGDLPDHVSPLGQGPVFQ